MRSKNLKVEHVGPYETCIGNFSDSLSKLYSLCSLAI